jgi:DNA-binding response OmpR family regulator
MTKVLYLEDEHYLGRIVKESLSSRGYDIRLVTDGNNLMRHFDQFHPDICVLDIMVPNIDGYTLSEMIRERDSNIPNIFLSAKNQTQDVLKGFKVGGNDYLRKPFSMEELIVRIENLLTLGKNSNNSMSGEKIQLGEYSFLPGKFELWHGESKISLSHRENELLKLIGDNKNQKIDRRVILNQLWGDDSLYNSRNLDVYIRKLRVYLEKDPNIQLKTLRGVGYYFGVGGSDE